MCKEMVVQQPSVRTARSLCKAVNGEDETLSFPRDLKAAWDRLNCRQQRFVIAYLENGGRGSEAVRQAGYQLKDNHGYSVKAAKLLANASIQVVLRFLFDSVHLTPETAQRILWEGLHATETKFFVHEGAVKEEREVIDYRARVVYLDIYHRVHGSYKSHALPDSAPLAPVIYLPRPLNHRSSHQQK